MVEWSAIEPSLARDLPGQMCSSCPAKSTCETLVGLGIEAINYVNLAAAMQPSSSSSSPVAIGSKILDDSCEGSIRSELQKTGRFDGTNYLLFPGDVLHFGGIVYNSDLAETAASPNAVQIYLQITFSSA